MLLRRMNEAILMLWKEKDLVVHPLPSKYTEIIKLSEQDNLGTIYFFNEMIQHCKILYELFHFKISVPFEF